jgi:hypothetical protein
VDDVYRVAVLGARLQARDDVLALVLASRAADKLLDHPVPPRLGMGTIAAFKAIQEILENRQDRSQADLVEAVLRQWRAATDGKVAEQPEWMANRAE